MATVTFLRPMQMSSYLVEVDSVVGQFTSTQIPMSINGTFTAACIGNFTDDGLQFTGTINRVILGTNPFSDLDITNLSFNASQDILNYFFEDGVGLSALLAGNDTFIGTVGADGFVGFGGNDTVSYAAASAGIFAGLLEGGSGGVAEGDSFNSIENLTGSRFDDILYGDDAVNILKGGNGDDGLVGKGGGDRFEGGSGSDTVFYDASFPISGNFAIRADLLDPASNQGDAAGDTYSSIENLEGSSFDDILLGNNSANIIRGNHYAGQSGNDELHGRGGNDKLFGNNGNDKLYGESESDELYGGAGIDEMRGGTGNDSYYVDNAGDKVIEVANAGADTVRSSVSHSLAVNVEKLILTGAANINGIGNALANAITGNAGSNTINGSTGKDVLTGGGGVDFFRFNTALNASTNVDSVTDFLVNTDKIQLENAIFTAIGPSLTADELVANANGAAANSLQHILYDTTDGRLFYDADGNGAQAKVHFATLNAGLALDHLDFVVI